MGSEYTLIERSRYHNIIDRKSDAEKKQLYSKIEKYLARAEEIKELVKTGDKSNNIAHRLSHSIIYQKLLQLTSESQIYSVLYKTASIQSVFFSYHIQDHIKLYI